MHVRFRRVGPPRVGADLVNRPVVDVDAVSSVDAKPVAISESTVVFVWKLLARLRASPPAFVDASLESVIGELPSEFQTSELLTLLLELLALPPAMFRCSLMGDMGPNVRAGPGSGGVIVEACRGTASMLVLSG